MATLRVTLLVATLFGLALLAAPRDAVATISPRAAFYGPIPGGVAYSRCLRHYFTCVSDLQRCSECVVLCVEAKRQNPVFESACTAAAYCRRRAHA